MRPRTLHQDKRAYLLSRRSHLLDSGRLWFNSFVSSCLRASVPPFVRASVPPCVRTSVSPSLHPFNSPCFVSPVPPCLFVYVPPFLCASVLAYLCFSVSPCLFAPVPLFHPTCISMFLNYWRTCKLFQRLCVNGGYTKTVDAWQCHMYGDLSTIDVDVYVAEKFFVTAAANFVVVVGYDLGQLRQFVLSG